MPTEARELSESSRILEATTEKPLPASPALAASIAALRESRLILPEIFSTSCVITLYFFTLELICSNEPAILSLRTFKLFIYSATFAISLLLAFPVSRIMLVSFVTWSILSVSLPNISTSSLFIPSTSLFTEVTFWRSLRMDFIIYWWQFSFSLIPFAIAIAISRHDLKPHEWQSNDLSISECLSSSKYAFSMSASVILRCTPASDLYVRR